MLRIEILSFEKDEIKWEFVTSILFCVLAFDLYLQ